MHQSSAQRAYIILGQLISLGLFACTPTDNLGGVFKPPGGDRGKVDPNLFPLKVGDTLAYGFSRSLRPTLNSSREKQIGGSVCVRIVSIADEFKQNKPTTLLANVLVRGTSAEEDVNFSDRENPNATAAEVDATLAPLWLSSLTFPTRDHGFESITQKDFATQIPLTALELGALLFFDVRATADCAWGAWDACSLEDTPVNYIANVYNDLRSILSTEALNQLSLRQTINPTCADIAYEPNCTNFSCSCPTATCSVLDGKCQGLYTLEFAWPETLIGEAVPEELQGNMLHSIFIRYDARGALVSMEEYIQPISALGDGNPVRPISQCVEVPCATAQISPAVFAAASCTF